MTTAKTDPLKFSVLLTTFNRAEVVVKTLRHILDQSFKNFEVLVWDDCSSDDTREKVTAVNDPRILYHRNEKNLGYGRNLQSCLEHATGDIVYLLGDDDVLLEGALDRTHAAFLRGDHIGVVTRPFYNFWDDPKKPIRSVFPFDPARDAELSIFDGRKAIEALFSSSWQLSGLALRRKYIDRPVHEDIFPAHVYPYASILRNYKAVFLKDVSVAVLTHLSMSTHKPEIYATSPIGSWIKMYETVYPEPRFAEVRRDGIDFTIRRTLPGLFQIKTSTSNRLVFREIRIILGRVPSLIFSPAFLFCAAVALAVPGRVLRAVLNAYKSKAAPRLARWGEKCPIFWGFGTRF